MVEIDGVPESHQVAPGVHSCVAWAWPGANNELVWAGGRGLAREKLGSCEGAPSSYDTHAGELGCCAVQRVWAQIRSARRRGWFDEVFVVKGWPE